MLDRITPEEYQQYIKDKKSFLKAKFPKKITRKNTARKVMGPGPDGKQHWYDSGFEASYSRQLIVMHKAGEIIAWFPHVMFMILEKDEVPGERPVRYTADFVVIHYINSTQKNAWLKRMKDVSVYDSRFFTGYNSALAGVEIHETKSEWLRKKRIDWPLRRKWFKLKYGIPVKEIIQK